MDTGTTTAKTTGAQTIKANAQTAQVCALGSNGKCSFCQRVGLPILPLRYAVIPNFLKGRSEDVLAAQATLGAGVSSRKLEGHHYTVRTLRAGFVHVYLGQPGHWQVYASTSDGVLRLLANPDDPDQKTSREMTARCKSEGHNIPASFIHVPKAFEKKTVWIAFARDAWSATTRANYEREPGKRMQSVDCAALSTAPDAQPHAFEITADAAKLGTLVDEYAATDAQAQDRRRYAWKEAADTDRSGRIDEGRSAWPSAHGFFPRTGQAPAVGRYAAEQVRKSAQGGAEKKVGAVVLFDPVGILEEINHLRLMVVEWRSKYASHPAVSRQRLVSQAIQGTREIYKNGALAKTFAEKNMVLVEQADDAARAAHPGKVLVPADQAEKTARNTPYVYYPPTMPSTAGVPVYTPPIESNVWTWSMQQAQSDWRRMEKHYDEKARADFDAAFKLQMDDFQAQLNRYGGDYVKWADDTAWRGWLGDYRPTAGEDVANAIKMCAPCLSGGPTDAQTFALWKKWLEAKPNDASNPVYVAMFGQAKSIVDFLLPDGLPFDASPDKGDKLYDTVKGLKGSKQGEEIARMIAADPGLASALSHIELAVGNAVTTIGSALSPMGQAVALRAQQVALHYYRGTQAVFVKLTMTVGQYVDALKAAGMAAAEAAKAGRRALGQVLEDVSTAGGKKVRALMLAGFINISDPRVRNIVVEVTLWTLEGATALRRTIESVQQEADGVVRGLSAEAAALVGKLRVAGITVAHEASLAVGQLARTLKLSASQTVSLAKKLMAGAVRIAASKGELLLAAASVLFQSWSLADSLRELRKKMGADKREAWLSVISASVGIAAGLAEAAGIALRALSVGSWKLALKVGGVLAALASAVDTIQAFCAAWRTGTQGDLDAAVYYALAGVAFAGATIAGFAALGAGVASGFAALSLAGPLGWAILLVVVGVGLLFAAMWAEDTPLEIWLDRCRFGKGARREGKWTEAQHAEEISALNSVILGAKAEIAFNDNWNELFSGTDTVNMRFTLPQFDAQGGSAYSIDVYALTAGGSMMPVYTRQLNRPQTANAPASVPDRYTVVAGSEKNEMDNGARVLSVDIDVNRSIYKKVQAKLRYWPDASDEDALLEIGTLVTD